MTNRSLENIGLAWRGACAATLLGCGSSVAVKSDSSGTTVTPGLPATIAIVSGDNQSAAPSGVLANPLVIVVKDANGTPVPNVPVSFSTGGDAHFVGGQAGNGQPVASTAGGLTNTAGQASAQY